MATQYLHWLAPIFEAAQVPFTPETAPLLDVALRRIAGQEPGASDEVVYQVLQQKWLRHGPSGEQLLCSLLRGEVFSRRDSSLRPHEGSGYFTNAETVPYPGRR